jgi:diguanylate cyclase (GGDEF)-like protein
VWEQQEFSVTLTAPGRHPKRFFPPRDFHPFLAPALVALFLFISTEAPGARTVLLSPEREVYTLGTVLDILEDPTKHFTIEQVSAPSFSGRFMPQRQQTICLGINRSAWWIRFTVAGTDSGTWTASKHWLLETPWPYVSSIRLYSPRGDGGWSVQEAGDPSYLSPGQEPGTLPLFSLPHDFQAPRTFFLRVESVSSIYLPLAIYTSDSYLTEAKRRMLWYGLYFGVIIALALYNLFLFTSLLHRRYFWYVLYITFMGLYFFGFNGLSREYIFTGNPELAARVLFFCLGVALLGAGLFTRSFLATSPNAPLMDRILVAYLWGTGILTALTPFLDFRSMNLLFSSIGAIAPVIILGAGAVTWRSGFRPARFFMLAWSVYAVTGLAFALTFRGTIHLDSWVFNSFQAGSALEAVLLSFALADRIKTMQREREEARRNERRYQELAITDRLTGLYNARYFHTQILTEIQRAESMDAPLSLLLLDADDFKQYNDTWGHPEGDRVLAGLGRAIHSCIRDNDLACRYGGEEFAVILRSSPGREAAEVAERIRVACAEPVYSPRPGYRNRVTVSIGVAEHIPGENGSSLVERADRALYRAKSEGKNRVVRENHGK